MRAAPVKIAVRSNSVESTMPPAKVSGASNAAQPPLWIQHRLPIQTSLTINQPGDKYEQEADRMADEVLRMPDPQLQRKICACGKPIGSGGMCDECKQKNLGIQRMASGAVPETTAPPIVHQTLHQPGHPLDGATRNFMEARFGQDFGKVRVHTDGEAARSAQAVNAHAFTVGSNIVFGQGAYAPHSNQGHRLLAHELAHIVQQQHTPTGLVQRESPPATDDAAAAKKFLQRRDIVFVMDFEEAARLVSADAEFFHVNTPEEMAEKLKGVAYPIGTIYVFAHSSTTANIKFPNSGFVTASSLAATLKDSIHPFWVPEAIDFRGCSVGMNPAGMEEIRLATNARAVIGSSCFLVFMTLPFTVDGVHIKTRKQLKVPKNKVTWDSHFPTHWKKFDSSACVLDKSADAYFKAGGFLVSIYANKEFTTAYSPTDSVCYNDLPVKSIAPKDALTYTPAATDPCTLIRVDVGAQTQTPTPTPTPSTTPTIEEQPDDGG